MKTLLISQRTPASPAPSFRLKFHFFLSASLLILAGAFTRAEAVSKLDLGAEYRIRGIHYGNVTYASEMIHNASSTERSTLDQDYYSQRARVYLKAKLDPAIEIGTVFQAIGVAGSTMALINRYPKEDFTPFIENAYIQANEIFDWPVSATVGRQPYVWGTGLLVSDDDLGFNGVRLDAGPLWGLKLHLFGAKAKENIQAGDHDLYLGGLEYDWGIHNIKLGYVIDSDRSGSQYFNLTSTNAVRSDEIKKQYIDLQVSGRLERGAFYQAEYAMQRGKVKRPATLSTKGGAAPQELTLGGSALTFEGGFDFIHPRWRRMILAFVFMQGSGDDPGTDAEDERFYPTFGHRYDGLERVGAGEFFAATPYSFFNEERAIVTTEGTSGNAGVLQEFQYNRMFSGLRTFGFRGSVTPLENFVAGLEFYLYTARELPIAGNNNSIATLNDNELGRELVISGHYTYAKRIRLGVRWGKFFASKNLGNLGASRLMIEASARF